MKLLTRLAFGMIASGLVLGVGHAAAADQFGVDSVHSNVVFKVGHLGVANMYGMFHAPEGSYSLDFANPSASRLEIKILTEKVDTGNEGRDRHLRNADFFNAKEHPEIRFVGKAFEAAGEKKMKVVGDLTMLGVTKPVTAMLTFIGEGETKQGYKSGFEASFTIKRSEFGMTKYLEENAISDEISLMVAIEGKKQ